MKIHFLGAGEACDPRHPNTAMLVKNGAEASFGRILLDCGFTVPHQYFSLEPEPDELEILWISHFHGDHFLGTPLLLLWLWEEGRHRPLHIVGPPGVSEKIKEAMELAYPNLLPRLGFTMSFHEIEPGRPREISNSLWQVAYNEHSQPCLSLRLELHDKALFYSGDGRPTPATRALATGCNLIIHEAYGLEDTTPGHGSIEACLAFARTAKVRQIALVHMQRNIRLRCRTTLAILEREYPEIKILLPEKDSMLSV